SYEATRRVFKGLRKLGWLEKISPREDRYITHLEWAETNPGKCTVRELLPWQGDADPLLRQIYGIAGGRIYLKPHVLPGLRKLGVSDDLIVSIFTKNMDAARARRGKGNYNGTSPKQILWQTFNFIKQEYERQQKNSDVENDNDSQVENAVYR